MEACNSFLLTSWLVLSWFCKLCKAAAAAMKNRAHKPKKRTKFEQFYEVIKKSKMGIQYLMVGLDLQR
jgi:hypothetical protein